MSCVSRTSRRLLVLSLAVAVGFWVSVAVAAQAAGPVSLFVRRTQVNCLEHGGRLYAPAQQLLTAMGFAWKQNADGFELRTGSGAGPELPSRGCTLVYGNHSVTPNTLMREGTVWVDVKQVAEGLGGLYIATPGAGMVQVTAPSARLTQRDIDRAVTLAANRPAAEAKPDVKSSGAPKDAATVASKDDGTDDALKAINEKRKDPLKVERCECQNNWVPNQITDIRGMAVIKNISDMPVRNIRFSVYATTRDGQPLGLYSDAKYIAELAPGDTASTEFTWPNYSYGDNVIPKVKTEFDPLPEKKPDTKLETPKADSKSDKGKQ